jgi:hypothetical protein
MNSLSALLRGVLRFAVIGALVIAGIVGFFVAWWLVLIAVLALSAYIGIRRFFGVKPSFPPPPGAAGAVIIEGEYEVERDTSDGTERARGRVIEVRQDAAPPQGDDKNLQ